MYVNANCIHLWWAKVYWTHVNADLLHLKWAKVWVTRLHANHIQYPRLFWASIMLKWANKYLWIERIQSWSVYGDSNSFSMVVLGKKMDCQKVAPFLRNPPTFKKRTQHFWDSKVSGAFPGGLWAKVFPNMSSTIIKKANPEIFIKILQFW